MEEKSVNTSHAPIGNANTFNNFIFSIPIHIIFSIDFISNSLILLIAFAVVSAVTKPIDKKSDSFSSLEKR